MVVTYSPQRSATVRFVHHTSGRVEALGGGMSAFGATQQEALVALRNVLLTAADERLDLWDHVSQNRAPDRWVTPAPT